MTIDPSNLRDFNLKVTEFTKNAPPELVQKTHQYLALQGLRRIVLRTPVDTGRARGGWQVTLSRPTVKLPAVRPDRSGQQTISRGVAKVGAIRPYSRSWIGNNVHYIGFLEDGSSSQAPRGMVRVTLLELQALVSRRR